MFNVFIAAVIVFVASLIIYDLICRYGLHTGAFRLLMPLRWGIDISLLVIFVCAAYGSIKIIG